MTSCSGWSTNCLWKERNPREAHRAHLIMVYDSQLTRDACCVPDNRRHVPPAANETVTMLSRRLLQAIAEGGSTVTWVKTRGHADKYVSRGEVSEAAFDTVLGNQAADAEATAGQRGHRKGVINLVAFMQRHLH